MRQVTRTYHPPSWGARRTTIRDCVECRITGIEQSTLAGILGI